MCYTYFMKVLNYRVIVEQDEDGVYVASVPSLQGCYSEGDTYEEAIQNVKDVIELRLKERKTKEPLPDDSYTEFVGIKNVTVSYGVSANSQT